QENEEIRIELAGNLHILAQSIRTHSQVILRANELKLATLDSPEIGMMYASDRLEVDGSSPLSLPSVEASQLRMQAPSISAGPIETSELTATATEGDLSFGDISSPIDASTFAL